MPAATSAAPAIAHGFGFGFGCRAPGALNVDLATLRAAREARAPFDPTPPQPTAFRRRGARRRRGGRVRRTRRRTPQEPPAAASAPAPRRDRVSLDAPRAR